MKIVLAMLVLSGCAGLIGNVSRPDSLTPAEIQAYKDAGVDIYSCMTIGGPPPTGQVTIITVPKGMELPVKFLPNCQAMMQ